jgi:flavin reductase (DIM6/NTAB) family NADH-FMN oxidoreductase RutF
MIISKNEIHSWDSKYRLKFVNSVSGYKGVHLIGTKGKEGNTNLAIFNSVVHISSNPARIGFIMRPLTVPRDTYKNILETEYYTINHVHKSFLEQAHYTSAKFTDQSEFDACNLKEEYIKDFKAPFVVESNIKIGLKLIEDIEIKANGSRLIIGEVQFVDVNQDYIEEDGQLDLEKTHDVCVTGLNQYSSVKKFINLPYARKEDAPNFKQKKRPDNVVFDEESQTYNAHLLPYGTDMAAPSISTNNLSTWKNQGIISFNHVLKSKINKIKEEYAELVEEYKANETLYKAKYEFEPIIGEVYHLYEKDNRDEKFLSMIPPETWNRTHLGSFKLNSEKVWVKLN